MVAAALTLVDEGGLERLTMRRLADRLGVYLPTIYRVVKGKDALGDEMAEAILANVVSAVADHADGDGSAGADAADWTGCIRRHAVSLRSALLTQRDGARIVGGNYAAKRAIVTFGDSLVGCLQSAGLPGEYALWGAGAVYCLVLGEVLEQQGAPAAEIGALQSAVAAGGYPHLAAAPVERMLDFDARFEFGLELLIAGIGSVESTMPPR